MADTLSNKPIDPVFVRAQFDGILAKEVMSFIKIDSDSALLTYNLATIACLVVAVEREREITDIIDSPPERFTKETFIKELVDIGLEQDADLESAVDSVIEMGCLTINSQGELKAEIVAFTITGFLDIMFPGMPGMNLVAFVMQMNDEVISGRKTLEYAKTSFIETLKSRGAAVTKKPEFHKTPDIKQTSGKVKKSNAKKNIKLKPLKISGKPSFYSTGGRGSDNVKVKSLFDKGQSEEKIKAAEAAEKAEAEKKLKEEEQKAKDLAQMEERIKQAEKKAAEAEKKAQELAIKEKERQIAKKKAEDAERKALELQKREAEKAAAKMETELKAMEEKLKAAEQERIRMEDNAKINSSEIRKKPDEPEKNIPQSDDADDIEARIAAFEAELAMPCPLCKKGKVVSETTSAGKDYYTCSDKNCRFVSWDKPYHFPCPQCSNPYLVEFDLPSGDKGLKCPRAGCSYTQDNLLDPVQNIALQAEKIMPRKKKKKRVVRRVRRRR